MLDTRARSVYLDEFKPPEGYVLDRAVGTTFTLDLITLLMAPLSIAFFDAENREDAFKDPVLLLEALRETSGKIAVFCHDGYISVPAHSFLLYSYLESAVIPVLPESENGIFHPKTWFIRFVKDEGNVLYRFLCLSRNLTFDKSWDTVLKLEGHVEDRKYGYGRNKPLADFITALKRLPGSALKPGAEAHLEKILSEIRQVDFEALDGFDGNIEFFPSGIERHRRQPDISSFDRCLMISPFLTDGIVRKLARSGRNNILISRAESIDAVSDRVIEEIHGNTGIFVMNEAAEEPDETSEEHAGAENAYPFHGLHAKMFLTESGWNAELRTGSANATGPAFNGESVEFMTSLSGKKSRIGIDKFLGDEKDRYAFINLLIPYRRTGVPNEEEAERKLQTLLEGARKAVISSRFAVEVFGEEGRRYATELKPQTGFSVVPGVEVRCRPVTLQQDEEKDLTSERSAAVFKGMSIESLTSFFIFTVAAETGGEKRTLSFVCNLPAAGIPEDERKRQVLLRVIGDKSRFLRYLLMILSENTNELFLNSLLRTPGSAGMQEDSTGTGYVPELPLLEELVKAFSRNPEKINRIDRLVRDIGRTEEGGKLIPEDFGILWNVFAQAAAAEEEP